MRWKQIEKPPCLSNRIINLLAKRNQSHKTWKRVKTEANLQKFKHLRAKVEKEIKIAKKRFYFKKFEKCIGDSRQTFTAKYLGVLLDNRLRFMDHIATVRNKLQVQCKIVSKLRHLVPKKLLL